MFLAIVPHAKFLYILIYTLVPFYLACITLRFLFLNLQESVGACVFNNFIPLSPDVMGQFKSTHLMFVAR